MNVAQVTIPLWVDLAAITIASISGAIFAAKFDNHRIDLLGIGIVGAATGLGGAFARDVLLGVTPAALSNNWYLPTTLVAALIGMMLERLIVRLDSLWKLLDALTVGMYAAIGMTKALGMGVAVLPATFIGALAAVGGSALRDMLLGIPVAMLRVGSLYAVAAVAGTAALAAALGCGANAHIAAIVCAVFTTLVRMCSERFGWSLPEQRSWMRGKTPVRGAPMRDTEGYVRAEPTR
ncbi:trimeric intracellular cation channel family protein [Aldersonia kunmingensis]|uniref:trimeric intracellular cation channel family protein n=1 Tax=Aldersonia kunmingensis TaxID=408066 RepID=UPI0008368A4A|nr:TRIC cation channel family protein [Aldersonia kunmingensis]